MHVHPPKPLHGWREFLNEVFIVVIGILIALALENVVERLRWREEREQSIKAIREEVVSNGLHAWERLAVNDCLKNSLHRLSQKLAASSGTWEADIEPVRGSVRFQSVPIVYGAPSRLYSSDAWKAAVSSGVFARLDRDEANRLSTEYEDFSLLKDQQEVESAAIAKMSILGYNLDIDQVSRVSLLQSIADADRANSFSRTLSASLLEYLPHNHFRFSAKERQEIEAARKEILNGQREVRGGCVRDLPLKID